MRSVLLPLLSLLLLLPLASCEDGTTTPPGVAADHEIASDGPAVPVTPDGDYGKPLLGVLPTVAKGDSVQGAAGLALTADQSSTAVWEVENDWEDTTTTAARAAGIAWGANSGLTWDQKYALWIEGMRKVDSYDAWYPTYELTTPWGKTVPAPNLECAETSMFLRATFAAWYKLPFYLVAGSGTSAIYFGHMGARTENGAYLSISFRTRYTDYRPQFAGQPAYAVVASWPHDTALQAKRLGTAGDDLNEFLAAGAGAGAYFDELFLNKRVGHFMIVLLQYYGSIHLASAQNTFNIQPSALRVGDSLLERWQSEGIGHTLIVKKVTDLGGGQMDAELISGSMPRRQGKWETGASSKSYFTSQYTGGSAMSGDGVSYAQLGGGIKRWRIPKARSGRWYLEIPLAARNVWVDSTNYAAIGARPAQFDQLLGELSPAELRTALLAKIDDKRRHLQEYPASCSAREGREEAFDELYALMRDEWGWTRDEVDANYRILDDYVLAELAYTQSKTCCWNTSNHDMYRAIMAYARERFQASNPCARPPVFKATNGGYQVFADYAASHGYPNWTAWNEDETCPQRATQNDVEAPHSWTEACAYENVLLGLEDPVNPDDPTDPVDPVDPVDPGDPGCSRSPLPEEPVAPAGSPGAAILLLSVLATTALRRRRR